MKLYLSIFVFLAISGHFILADRCTECSRAAEHNVITPVISNLQRSPHIVGGAEASPHTFPYAVFLKIYITNDTVRSARYCGGALISPQWVLTAAHCVENADEIFATVGAHDVRIHERTQQIEIVKESVKHPNWEPISASNDVALLKLKLNFTLGWYVKTIRLPAWSQRADWFWRASVKVAGWGMSSPKEIAWLPSSLRTLNSTIITNFYCSWRYGFKRINDYHICTDDSNKNAPYKGDGGDPLVLTDSDGQPTLVGVVSKDTQGGFENSYPTVSTRVTHYLKWISNTTGIPLRERSQ